jgi:hypothetical protein
MNASALQNISINISNGWIISCSILTFGIIRCIYLRSISNNLSETKKLEDNNLTLLDEDEEEYLDDDAWVANKKEFWKINNISPIIIKGNSITPGELANLLHVFSFKKTI